MGWKGQKTSSFINEFIDNTTAAVVTALFSDLNRTGDDCLAAVLPLCRIFPRKFPHQFSI